MGEGGEMPPEERWVPKRGDLIECTDMDAMGIVLGWVDEESLCFFKIPDGKIVAYPFDSDCRLLVSAEKLQDLESWLPKQVNLKYIRPS